MFLFMEINRSHVMNEQNKDENKNENKNKSVELYYFRIRKIRILNRLLMIIFHFLNIDLNIEQ